MKEVVIFGRNEPPCPFCEVAKSALDASGIIYKYKDIAVESNYLEFGSHRLRSVPAIFVDGVFKHGVDTIQKTIKEILSND